MRHTRTSEGMEALQLRIAELEAEARRHRATLQSIGDAVIATDAQGRVTQMNPVAEVLTGWSEAEASGRPFAEVFRVTIEGGQEPVPDPVRRVLEANGPVSLPNRAVLVARDGTERYVSDSGAPIRDEEGRVTGVVLVFRDETVTRTAEHSLLESERRLRSTMENMLEGCQILDFELRYRYLNAAVESHARRPREELLGRRFEEMYPGVEGTELYQKIRACLEERIADRMVNEFVYPDGTHAWFELRFEPVPEGVLILSVDVTEKCQQERRAEHLNQLLTATQRVNRMAARERDPERLVQRACEILVEARSYSAAWIVLGPPGQSPSFVGQTGWGPSFLEFRRRLAEGWQPRCITSGQSCPVEPSNPTPDASCAGCPLWNPATHGPAGVVPLEHDGRRIGTLGISFPPGLTMNTEEADLLHGVANDLALALQGIESERQRSLHAEMAANAQDGMALVAADGTFLAANPAYGLIVGRDTGQIIGQPVAAVMGQPFFETVVQPNLERCMRGETVVFEATRSLPGLGERTLDVQYSPCIDHRGEVHAVVFRVRDVTDRRHAEAALRDSQARFSMIFQRSPVGIFISRVSDGTIIDANDAFAAMHGFEREEMIGRTSLELGMWVDPQQRAEHVRNLLEGRADLQFETRARRKDGVVRDVSVSVELIEWNGEKQMLGLSQDITQRKDSERALGARKVLLDAQLEASSDGILVLDEHDRQLIRNRRFVDMWRIPQSIVDAQDDDAMRAHVAAHLEDPAAYLARVRELIQNRKESAIEELLLKDGRVIERHSAPMLGPDGRYFGRIWHFRDITERRHAEAQRTKLEEQLRASQKLEAIGTLAGGIAHDFNNLLVVILNYAQFALDSLPPEARARKDLLEVKQAGERAAALTRQLLAFSRKQVMQAVRLSLNQVASDLETMLRRIVGEDVEFVMDLDPRTGLVMADPSQIEQVLMNLVVNARDAMPEGGRLTITTSNVELTDADAREFVEVVPGEYVQLTVTDTGVGMDEATRARIFEPFFTTKPTGRGTGLGLSTTYGIVKQSQGYIWVRSAPGRGTTFTVQLPRDLTGTTARPRPTSLPSSTHGTETVLLVEDEPALRTIARRFLESAGYQVLVAGDGTEAMNVIARHAAPVQLLLTDVVMPRVGGGRLAQELQRSSPDLKVLYMSGYTDDTIENHGVFAPGAHFLAKPFTSAELVRKVREVLDGTDLVEEDRAG